MLDKQDISIIKEMMDAQSEEFDRKLNAQSEEFFRKLDAQSEEFFRKLDAQGEEFSRKLDAQGKEFDKKLEAQGSQFTHQLNLLIENYFEPKFKLLAEGHQVLLDTMAPKSRVDALEDEVIFMKQVIKSMSQDIAELKKAQ